MVLELHIWGPAFDLPSIDAQCLAAVCYLQTCLPSDGWSLIPSSDPTTIPVGELPALRHGSTWVAGFDNIVAYLRDISNGEWDLDKDLSQTQRADRAALLAFLDSRGQPLLDLSLYVSSDNYLSSTRPALSHILTWPNSWVVPQQLRANAKKRSEHLGLGSLDVDTAQEDQDEDARLTAHIPKSLRKPKKTVSGLLGRNVQKNRFRLDAITSDFFEPLLQTLEDKDSFFGEEESSVDCVAIAYLALMQSPQLPQGWLGETLQTKYPKLDQWSQKRVAETFQSPVDVDLVLGRKDGITSAKLALPWRIPSERSVPQILQAVLESCIGSLPVLGSWYAILDTGAEHTGNLDRYHTKQAKLVRLHRRREIYIQLLASTCALTGLAGWMLYKGILQFPRRVPAVSRSRSFGEAGALLGLV